jgi:hypothetical protein
MSSLVPQRQLLSLLPARATTGIGSLPHTQAELALQMALQVDVPYVPQLPIGHPTEFMIAGALEGVPGLIVDGEGMCQVELAAWRAGRDAFTEKLGRALRDDKALEELQPSPEACRAWRPFLWEVEQRKLAFAKSQLAGPLTVRWVAKADDGRVLADVPELDQEIYRLLLAKSLAMVKALRKANTTPVFYLDEPGLYALDPRDARHVLALQELKLLAKALQREGALVGIHFCGNTDWSHVLSLGFDLISLDVRLSLDALLEEDAAVRGFLEAGGAFSYGIIPTDLGQEFDVRELVDALETSVRSALPGALAERALDRCLLTPACGLAMRTVADSEEVMAQLKDARNLLARVGGGADSPALL